MVQSTETIVSRIAWCQLQKTQGGEPLELEGWDAEEEGLRDALLNRDHTQQYQYSSPGVCERYVMGLHDGQALIRIAAVMDHHRKTSHPQDPEGMSEPGR